MSPLSGVTYVSTLRSHMCLHSQESHVSRLSGVTCVSTLQTRDICLDSHMPPLSRRECLMSHTSPLSRLASDSRLSAQGRPALGTALGIQGSERRP
jgi:hypothetical protein